MKQEKRNNIICIILTLLALVIFYTCTYINSNFSGVSFEQILYSILNSKGTSINALKDGIIYVSLFSIITFVILYIIVKLNHKYLENKYRLTITIKNKKYLIDALYLRKKRILLYSIILIILSLYNCYDKLGVKEYIRFQNSKSTLIEDNYVNPKEVNITFPGIKQNLIYIFVESLETSATSIINGGDVEKSYIPNLENIALNNINFSNKDSLGGAKNLSLTTWTAAGMVAETSGIPLKVIEANNYTGYGESLPGATSIGDILEENGYKNYLLLGSDASFGGRKDYFTYHGNYEIYDLYYARDNNWIDEDYYKWWGFEDRKLFSFAKKELKRISKNNEPFNFTILTADTHFYDGYQDKKCKKEFDSDYANSYYCLDKMLNSFIEWIKKQDFYKNTTIIISGDHLTMQNGFFNEENYERTVYNTFINSKATSNTYKNRMFTTMDMFPTTLASLGVKIEGNKLGLGTNLFSNEQTLIEKYDYNYVNEEIKKKSFYYDNVLLGKSYYEMYKK